MNAEPRFTQKFDVSGRLSIADLIPKSKVRRGIYMLHFEDGLSYIGKAEDVVRRFGQHRKSYENIVAVWFQPIKTGNLYEFETEMIRLAPSLGYRLTNIVDGLELLGETDLDTLVSPVEQEQWKAGPALFAAEMIRVEDEAHRLKYRSKFMRFRAKPNFNEIVHVLRHYVHECVPVYRRTERTFWSLSCLPSTNGNRLNCLNINTMEILVIGFDKEQPDVIWSFLNVAESTFTKTYKNDDAFYRIYPDTEIGDIIYSAAGPDVINIQIDDLTTLAQVLQDPAVVEASRTLNLRAMRKGATMHWRSHCFDLADLVV